VASDIPLTGRTNSTATFLSAVAGLVVVHRAVLAALLAALRRGLGRKRACANRCRQNRKQNFRVRLHTLNLPREMN